jgi:formamidopyrimidine-DNA glycosylase (fpg)
MPELPEVETTRIGIAPYVVGKKITGVVLRDRRLRRPVPRQLKRILTGQTVRKLTRRAKYLLFHCDKGCMILHLGMSGSLRILANDPPPGKHDHADIIFGSCSLRFRDPRRFGCILWTAADPLQHELLRNLGPEPLSEVLTGAYLFTKSRRRKQSIKTFLMDSRIIAGVGNIYANESLFLAGIHPKHGAGAITRKRYEKLARSIKEVLKQSLTRGGTTLRDFVNGLGEPGYFRHELQVYDRGGMPCCKCKTPIKIQRLGQRSTFYCPRCQQ